MKTSSCLAVVAAAALCVLATFSGYANAGEPAPEKYIAYSWVDFNGVKTFECSEKSKYYDRQKALSGESKKAYDELKDTASAWNKAHTRYPYPLDLPRVEGGGHQGHQCQQEAQIQQPAR